jgi:hypothetical protein
MPKDDDVPEDDEIEEEPEDDEPETDDPEAQKEVMRKWFLQHYTDPVENTPYETAEGGYQYIWGGPYDPQEELSDKFGGHFPDEVIEELAEELTDVAPDWTGNPDEYALDEYEFEMSRSTEHRASFDEAVTIVHAILNEKFNKDLLQALWRQQYVAIFSALETYLFDFFYSSIKADTELFRKFVEFNKEFEKTKFNLADIYQQHEKLDQTVREFLQGLSWHNLPRISPFYRHVLDIEFDKELLGKLSKAVLMRHDIVHRNGRRIDTKDGKKGDKVVLSKQQLIQLIFWVNDFVAKIEKQWRSKKNNKKPKKPN